MTTRSTPKRVSRMKDAYEQSNHPLPDLAESAKALRAEIRSLRTTIIVIGGGYWASIVGGFIALLVTD